MKYLEIRKYPTVLREMSKSCTGVHESLLKSYHIVQKVKELCCKNVAASVILELIELMEDSREEK